jgi:phosphate-selective porin OprO/OprP
MRVVKLFWRLAAIGIVAVASTTALAQEYYPGGQTQMVTVSAANLAAMSNRIDALEASLGGDKGKELWKDVSSEGWSHKWGGRIMGDYVMHADQNAASLAKFGDIDNYFEFRRLRLFVEGEGYGIYDYKFQVDFEPENINSADVVVWNDDGDGIIQIGELEEDEIRFGSEAVAIKDMYFGIHEVPLAGYIRFGHYKAPFSLEELTSSKYITFMERSLPNIFAPGREVGITAYNHSTNQNWTWAGGVFVDSLSEILKEGVSDNLGTSLVGRMTWTPYYDEPSNGRYLMHLGLNGRWTDDRDNLMRFRARPEIHEGPRFIDSGTIVGDWWTVIGPEAAVVWGPFSLQAEYMAVQVDDDAFGTRNFHGAYLYGSWFLTGESRAYKRGSAAFGRVKPYTNFWIVRGAGIGTGAVELAARWSYLDISSTGDAEAGQQNDVTLGLNWHWNPHVRWMFNYIHAFNEYDNGDPNAEDGIFAMRGHFDL